MMSDDDDGDDDNNCQCNDEWVEARKQEKVNGTRKIIASFFSWLTLPLTTIPIIHAIVYPIHSVIRIIVETCIRILS